MSISIDCCTNYPRLDVAQALRLGKMEEFVRKQVRRMTLAALTPVVLVYNSPSFKRVPWNPSTRDGAGERSTALRPLRKTEKRQSTWDPGCTSAAPQMRGNPDLACVVSRSIAIRTCSLEAFLDLLLICSRLPKVYVRWLMSIHDPGKRSVLIAAIIYNL